MEISFLAPTDRGRGTITMPLEYRTPSNVLKRIWEPWGQSTLTNVSTWVQNLFKKLFFWQALK